jgi:hypothetical protein
MSIRKSLVASLALAVAFAFAPMDALRAASPMGPGTALEVGSLTHAVQAKKAAKKTKVARKGPGHCGTGKYWDKKKKACASK